MTRVTTTLLIFMILMNGTATVMGASGLSDDLGVELAPGVSDTVNDAVNTAQSGFTADAGLGETLISVILSALQLFSALIQGVFAMPVMFTNLGFPDYLVTVIAMPLYIIAVLEFIFLATGRDML